MNQSPLSNRAALVTGVSRRVGIGYGIASRLAALGADLFLHGYPPYDAQQPWGADAGGLEAIVSSLRSGSRQVAYAETDLLEPLAPSRLVASAVERFGHVDILIANHAYGTTGD